jgi:hypothetical protein
MVLVLPVVAVMGAVVFEVVVVVVVLEPVVAVPCALTPTANIRAINNTERFLMVFIVLVFGVNNKTKGMNSTEKLCNEPAIFY